MEMINACLCCMLRPPDKGLSTPYPRLDSTEIYSDMLEYCFQIQLTTGGEEGGICDDCVGQLRDARDFRLQVECSQARLQTQLRPWPPLEAEPETCTDEASNKSQLNEQAPVVIEIVTDSEDESYGDTSQVPTSKDEKPPVKVEAETDSGDEARGELLRDSDTAGSESDTAGAASDTAAAESDTAGAENDTAAAESDTAGAESDTAAAASDTAGAESDTEGAESARAREQLAMSCCVRLERLRPREGSPRPATPDSAAAEPHLPTRRRSSDQHQDKAFFCFMCKKQFTEISDLVVHMETHAGQKPHSCLVCYKVFAIKSHLKLHSKIHWKDYNQIKQADKYYQCDICDKKFTERECFTEHMRTHKRQKMYPCDVCGRSLSCKSHFIRHKRVHTGERPFPCEECNKRFKSNNHLKDHMRVHTGIKPHTCDICKNQFTYKSNLVVHMRRHHHISRRTSIA